MATPRTPVTNFTLETIVAFIGALLIIPIAIKLLVGFVRAIFRMGIVRRLIMDSVVIGLTALLTREDVLNRLFGQPGRQGDGLLKPGSDD
jgi:hypothetical protein